VSVIFVFPYILTLQGDILRQLGVSIPLLFVAQLVQSAILFSVTIFVGLLLSQKIGFTLPLLSALVQKTEYKKVFTAIVPLSVVAGILTAIAIYVSDFLFSIQGAALSTHQNLAPVWQKLLAAFYGGIVEEVIMRLFLMTLFIWIAMKVMRRTEPNKASIVVSIILAAIIFGLGHLPVTATLTALTPLIILRAIVLNGIGGIVFGWLYWKKGFESAVIAHFTTDIFLLTILPLIFK
jgi:membrane protease YdiL (CAAX protease family)